MTLIYNALEGIKPYFTRGCFGVSMAVLTIIFAVASIFAIATQIFIDKVGDNVSTIQLAIDEELASDHPDKVKIKRYLALLHGNDNIGGLLNTQKFPNNALKFPDHPKP